MDDVTSGMNIGENLSTDARFNELLGFTASETKEILKYYRDAACPGMDPDLCFHTTEQWYDGYRFDIKGRKGKVFNSDMVLYFIKEYMKENEMPYDMIDHNIRIDYTKLRHLMLTDRKFNGNFSELKKITEKGETHCSVQTSFPLDQLLDPDNFISLLYYFGLLTITGVRGKHQILGIPNMTIRKLMYGYIRDAYRDVDIFRINFREFGDLIYEMAYNGDWKPVFQFIAQEIETQTSVRNYLDGERAVQMFLLAYLNISDYYICQTEREMSKGIRIFFWNRSWPGFRI